jgi:hypothetical protein
MRLLLSNNKHVENSVNKDGMETWGNQQLAVRTGGEATPADNNHYFAHHYAPFLQNLASYGVLVIAGGEPGGDGYTNSQLMKEGINWIEQLLF